MASNQCRKMAQAPTYGMKPNGMGDRGWPALFGGPPLSGRGQASGLVEVDETCMVRRREN